MFSTGEDASEEAGVRLECFAEARVASLKTVLVCPVGQGHINFPPLPSGRPLTSILPDTASGQKWPRCVPKDT